MRHSHDDIIESALRDWRAVLEVISDGPFFFGNEPIGALATPVLSSRRSETPGSQPACVAYAERMRARFFPDLATAPARLAAARTKSSARAAQIGV